MEELLSSSFLTLQAQEKSASIMTFSGESIYPSFSPQAVVFTLYLLMSFNDWNTQESFQ